MDDRYPKGSLQQIIDALECISEELEQKEDFTNAQILDFNIGRLMVIKDSF